MKQMQSIISNAFEVIQKNRFSSFPKAIKIAFDTRWSARGYTAKESTTTCFIIDDSNNYKLLFLVNLQKSGPNTNHEGSSKSMECKGTELLMRELHNNKFTVMSFVHDNDAASKNEVLKVFPDAIEFHDRLHRQRAIRRSIYKSQIKELKKKLWIDKIMKTVSAILFNSYTKEEKEQYKEKKIKDWFEGSEEKSRLSKDHLPFVSKIFNELFTDYKKLNHHFNTNHNESFHSLICRYCPKGTPQPSSYKYKVSRAGLSSIYGALDTSVICSALNTQFFMLRTIQYKNYIYKQIPRREYLRVYQRTEKYKQNRRERDKKKRGERLKEKADASYGVIANSKCTCKKTMCISKKCSCKKIGKMCSDVCKCLLCKNNCPQ